MLDNRFASGSTFDDYRSQLGHWLRSNMDSVRSLTKIEIECYEKKNIISGWYAKEPSHQYEFLILLNDTFPFSKVQIALQGDDHYLEWPHVEEYGFLCLSQEGWLPIENIDYSIRQTLCDAVQLIEDCSSSIDFIESESSKEFVTYWNRAATGVGLVLSLLDVSNQSIRRVCRCTYDRFHLIGESEEQLQSWMNNLNISSDVEFKQAIYRPIDKAPYLPLPRSSRQLVTKFIDPYADTNIHIENLNHQKITFFLFSANTPDGIGLISANFPSIPKSGLRQQSKKKGRRRNPVSKVVKSHWKLLGGSKLFESRRADSSWIHGRGLDPNHAILSQSKIVILGAGSLGSQVAMRLAQAGIGNLTIIDPERLEPSNVGRHALGVDSYIFGTSKAEDLETVILKKFPHSKIKGYKNSWQEFVSNKPNLANECDLIISCIGESNVDLAWDEWFQTSNINAPTIYGWLGTQGTTGHSLGVHAGTVGLSCFFDERGYLRSPDTDFNGITLMKPEPGCGTMFQPYGPLAVGHVELLVTRHAIDFLTKRINLPDHRVWACSTNDLINLNGKWTDKHLHFRPDGYLGPFEYNEDVVACGECYQCQKK